MFCHLSGYKRSFYIYHVVVNTRKVLCHAFHQITICACWSVPISDWFIHTDIPRKDYGCFFLLSVWCENLYLKISCLLIINHDRFPNGFKHTPSKKREIEEELYLKIIYYLLIPDNYLWIIKVPMSNLPLGMYFFSQMRKI